MAKFATPGDMIYLHQRSDLLRDNHSKIPVTSAAHSFQCQLTHKMPLGKFRMAIYLFCCCLWHLCIYIYIYIHTMLKYHFSQHLSCPEYCYHHSLRVGRSAYKLKLKKKKKSFYYFFKVFLNSSFYSKMDTYTCDQLSLKGP